MKKIIAILFASAFLISCEETILLDTDQVQPQVVIEGLISNQFKSHYVKVSQTVDFYQPGITPRVENATVTVSDDMGNDITFVHNPGGDPDSVGFYMSPPFAGSPGTTYSLDVVVNGQSYSASEQMQPLTPIDTVTYQLTTTFFREQEDIDAGRDYELVLFAEEPADRVDFYLFNFYRNGELQNGDGVDIYFFDDEELSTSLDGLATPVYYALGDTATVEMLSLSRDGFIYYFDLSIALNNDSGMFSPPPANPRNNLSNGALGYFQVSAIETATLVVE